jgi:ribosomal protein L2
MRRNANMMITEASRAKHKFAVKRNSWPKTRGVAMNPGTDPQECIFFFSYCF